MTEWKKVRIGDFLTRVKYPIALEANTEYQLVTVKMHHKGVVLRERKLGGKIGSTMYQVNAGQFILSGIDARNGAFGIVPEELDGAVVTNDFWYFDLNEDVVKRDFFYWLTSTPLFLDACIKSSEGTTNRRRLQRNKFFDFEFQIPEIEQQIAILREIEQKQAFQENISIEITAQQTLIQQLRQTILQEAVQGKLTAAWRQAYPEVEPASELLKRIQAEKAQLVKAGKISPPKPLPPIQAKEIPFELPAGWVWCRLGEVAEHCLGKMLDYAKNRGQYQPYLRNLNIRWQGFDLDDLKKMRFEDHEEERYGVKSGDVLICEGGEPGRAAIWKEEIENMKIQKAIHRVRFFSGIDSDFFLNYLMWSAKSKYLNDYFTGSGIKHLTGKSLAKFVFPLPPAAEQEAIITKV